MSHNDIERNKRVANIWTARFMPFALTGVVGYVTYVMVAILCGKGKNDMSNSIRLANILLSSKFSLGETEK